MQRFLIVTGIVVLMIGLGWPWVERLPFGHLPGDIHIVRDGYSIHLPIVTCLVVSVLVSVLLWIVRRW